MVESGVDGVQAGEVISTGSIGAGCVENCGWRWRAGVVRHVALVDPVYPVEPVEPVDPVEPVEASGPRRGTRASVSRETFV
ncbi:hypothetical protein [Cryobacterium psychrophilum]|uniref:hypothetical protein n=1 Tax=Cryobacterium psychrophilum TaxID=41988 RepID=UPI00106625FE|nr:hypothetical protein [Cryobacterium psychrophilum]